MRSQRDLRADDPLCDNCARGTHRACPYTRPCPCECRNQSMLSHYSLRSDVVLWLIARAPELVATAPGRLRVSDAAPRCPDEKCGAKMLLRPGFWKCFLHGDEPVAVQVRPQYERAPAGDVLALARKAGR